MTAARNRKPGPLRRLAAAVFGEPTDPDGHPDTTGLGVLRSERGGRAEQQPWWQARPPMLNPKYDTMPDVWKRLWRANQE